MNAGIHLRVLNRLCGLFDVPIIQNNLRGMYVELLVSELLGGDWESVSGDWAAWDIEHADSTKLEVKQSAAKQSWDAPEAGSSPPTFGIRVPKFTWVGAVRSIAIGRPAQIYVFAWHEFYDQSADHRDLDQWQFFVIPSARLPNQKTIGLNPLRNLARSVSAAELRAAVDEIRLNGVMQ